MVFLFAEIDHPALFKELGNPEANHILACQYFLLEEILHSHGVQWMKRTPRGILSAFTEGEPLDKAQGGPAVAALAIQKDFQGHLWDKYGKAKVRLVLHCGEAEAAGQDYVGPEVNHALKLLDAAWGSQTLLTVPAVHFIPLPPGSRLLDMGSHFLKDLSEPGNVYAFQHPDLSPEACPALRSLQTYPQNLFPQGSPFFGRQEEIAEITGLLTDPSTRLVTLLGPGGFGKTRLALQCAAEVIERFQDGVYLIPLAPLLSEQLLIGGIANAIKFYFYGADDPKDQLFNHLKGKKMLLVMDNFEHIIDGSQLVREMLEAASDLKVMATSRESLRIGGERIFEVMGLRYPEIAGEGLESSSAAQLFLKSARRIRPNFTLKPEERPALLKICQLLEGMPLGLELSATWAGNLSLPEIADKIESSRDFLATSMPHLPPRHRSLRAVFEYSWILLNETQKKVLKAVSIFKGGFTLQAAREVAGATGQILSYLEHKSLVRKRMDGRFEIHELLKYYAKEKLFDDQPEKERVMDAHCVYFADFLKKGEKEMFGPRQGKVLEELVVEIGNIREAWKRAVEKGREREMDLFMDSLYHIFFNRGWIEEARQSFRDAAESIREKYPVSQKMPSKAKVLMARAMAYEAGFENDLGRPKEARVLFEESLSLFKAAGAMNRSGYAWGGLAIVTETMGDYKMAKGFYEKGLREFRRGKDRGGITWALNNLGHILVRMNKIREAEPLIRQSLKYSTADRDLRAMAYGYNLLGDICYETGLLQEAKAQYQKGFAAFLESGERKGIAWSFTSLGQVAEALGDYSGARQMFQEAMALAQDMGDRRALAWTKNLLGNVGWSTGEYETALKLYSEGLALYREVGDLRGEAWALDQMANLKLAMGDDKEAEKIYLQSFSLVVKEGLNPQNIAWNFYHLGAVSLFRGDRKEARERFTKAFGHFEQIGDKLGQAATLIHLSEEACSHKDYRNAEMYLRQGAKLILPSKSAPLLVDLLAAVAQLLKAQGDEQKAISLLMVALAHPACRRQTKDRMVSLTLELESRFTPQEVEGGLRWAKSARIEDVAAAWAFVPEGKKKSKTKPKQKSKAHLKKRPQKRRKRK